MAASCFFVASLSYASPQHHPDRRAVQNAPSYVILGIDGESDTTVNVQNANSGEPKGFKHAGANTNTQYPISVPTGNKGITNMGAFEDMHEKVCKADGFIAALDQSGGSTPKALKIYGISDNVSCICLAINA
jgi:hypothetical protein